MGWAGIGDYGCVVFKVNCFFMWLDLLLVMNPDFKSKGASEVPRLPWPPTADYYTNYLHANLFQHVSKSN